MKKAALALGAVLALGVVSPTFAQDGQRPPRERGNRPNAQQRDRGDRGDRPEARQRQRPNLKPILFANLGDDCYTPDGMTIDPATGLLYLNVPNFGRMDEKMVKADSAQGGYLFTIDEAGNKTFVLEYPILERTGQTGPMGMAFGPDGNLYVCDNQYFHNKDYASRILRVVFENGKATDKVETVIEGVKLANGMNFFGDKMFYTDSCFDEETTDEIIGSGGVFMFTMAELASAGKDGADPIKIKAGKDEPHCVAYAQVKKLGRGDNTGPDGLCIDKRGTLWFGNFGNGMLYALRPTKEGEYKQENLELVFDSSKQREREGRSKLECCDGIFYDKQLDCVYVDDSVNNAIWVFKPSKKGEKVRPVVLWENDDNNGNDGLLDQPCEAVVYAGKLLAVNFDWPFPGMKNTAVDAPGTISAFDYAEVKKFVKNLEQRQKDRRPNDKRPNDKRGGDRPKDRPQDRPEEK